MFCKYYILILFIYKSFTVSTIIMKFTITVIFTNSVQNIQHVTFNLNAIFFHTDGSLKRDDGDSGFTGSISGTPACEAETSLDTEDIQSDTQRAVSHDTAHTWNTTQWPDRLTFALHHSVMHSQQNTWPHGVHVECLRSSKHKIQREERHTASLAWPLHTQNTDTQVSLLIKTHLYPHTHWF